MVFIGRNMNKEIITKALDECLVNDDEMKGGDGLWGKLENPFPQYN